ncbi:hypothetical protein [Bacillus sp. 005/A4HT-01/001]|nr:hypothetical protein [Bacillus sp. 005/A4HT-01/001]
MRHKWTEIGDKKCELRDIILSKTRIAKTSEMDLVTRLEPNDS